MCGQFLLDSSCFADFEEFFLKKFFWEFISPQTPKCYSGFLVSSMVCKPSRRFGDEEHEDGKEDWDNEKNGNGDLITMATVDGGSIIVDDGAD